MSRYSGSWGGGYFPHRRPSSVAPPYPMMLVDPAHVTDEDFQYITSEDLINHHQPAPVLPYFTPGGRRTIRARSRPRSITPPPPDDDVLIIKNKGITYPAHFEAYSIFDEEVLVRHVQDKIGAMMELSPEATRDVKLLYKGKNMTDLDTPVKTYGVKNNSEILAVVREAPRSRRSEREDGSAISSGSSEDIIVATDGEANPLRRQKSRKFKRRSSRHIHRESMASVLSLPNFGSEGVVEGRRERRERRDDRRDDRREDRWTDRREEWTRDDLAERRDERAPPSPPPPPLQIQPLARSLAAPSPVIDKLDSILDTFEAEFVPLCNQFLADPPTDPKKVTEEHAKLSEAVFQCVLLKLDEVDSGGSDDARTRRKQLVNHTQDVIEILDKAKARALNRAT